MIIIQTFKKENDILSLPKTLEIHKPHFIVMYDADMTAIRQIEVQASILFSQNVSTSAKLMLISILRYSKIIMLTSGLLFIFLFTPEQWKSKLI